MKASLRVFNRRIALEVRDDYGVLAEPCPKCSASPCKVQGTGRRISADDRAYEATGVCLACNLEVGTIRVETSTLFGLAEDERVMRSGFQVF